MKFWKKGKIMKKEKIISLDFFFTLLFFFFFSQEEKYYLILRNSKNA